ncbi:hypothetical protein H0A36_15795 [Endozoicomonas sp. SM1973]|uniref:Peptidase S8/S53 domain-containing protein n=1 Tax=Spartinivicinus marinus TaxID=2994442 RepID=A0A853I0H3_9GAMM|nr:S8 family serine peptidase [Spartinivicinus marinus]MCX4028408.1 hypothetical protein [Spartinivicinus marinus]NYZ67480.1 hypothetical protein [Spartinivicinus marinus]
MKPAIKFSTIFFIALNCSNLKAVTVDEVKNELSPNLNKYSKLLINDIANSSDYKNELYKVWIEINFNLPDKEKKELVELVNSNYLIGLNYEKHIKGPIYREYMALDIDTLKKFANHPNILNIIASPEGRNIKVAVFTTGIPSNRPEIEHVDEHCLLPLYDMEGFDPDYDDGLYEPEDKKYQKKSSCPSGSSRQSGKGAAYNIDNASYMGAEIVSSIAAKKYKSGSKKESIAKIGSAYLSDISVYNVHHTIYRPNNLYGSELGPDGGTYDWLGIKEGLLEYVNNPNKKVDIIYLPSLYYRGVKGSDCSEHSVVQNSENTFFQIRQAINDLIARGVVVVTPTGNKGYTGQTAFPACLPETISVTAHSPINLPIFFIDDRGLLGTPRVGDWLNSPYTANVPMPFANISKNTTISAEGIPINYVPTINKLDAEAIISAGNKEYFSASTHLAAAETLSCIAKLKEIEPSLNQQAIKNYLTKNSYGYTYKPGDTLNPVPLLNCDAAIDDLLSR